MGIKNIGLVTTSPLAAPQETQRNLDVYFEFKETSRWHEYAIQQASRWWNCVHICVPVNQAFICTAAFRTSQLLVTTILQDICEPFSSSQHIARDLTTISFVSDWHEPKLSTPITK